MPTLRFRIYRYDPESGAPPRMQKYALDFDPRGKKVLDALIAIKEGLDESLAFRRSCREGVCGSDGLNINGVNQLACITDLADLREPIEIRPLPGLAVVRDLIVDLSLFYQHYRAVKPYLINLDPEAEIERLQMPAERAELDGLYECILCACCTTSCPSFWWNADRYLGPAALLQAYRFIADSRDRATDERLDFLEDPYRLFRCRGIMNCTEVCPKGPNPARAIELIKLRMIQAEL